MAKQEQIERLKRSVEEWNAWRRERSLRLDLGEAILYEIDLSGADLTGTNLSFADLTNANLINANLSFADLSGADLNYANLFEANLTRANLSGTDLTASSLSGADLSKADLGRASILGTNLINTKFINTILFYADLRGADLRGADLSYVLTAGTTFGNLDLSTVKGLETVEHHAPSTIGIDTIIRSKGDIPEIFLRGAGLDDTFIRYILSLAKRPIQYNSCFISYSSKDQVFADRLYADLQANGVRCWFAPEDLKIGDPFRQRIDESIYFYDKLLLVLSIHSVASPWVQKEVETAFEKEHRSNRLVLFPVKLDESIMQTDQAWASDIRRMRHIGDFTRWKEHDAYQKVLERLLRDLKTDITKDTQ